MALLEIAMLGTQVNVRSVFHEYLLKTKGWESMIFGSHSVQKKTTNIHNEDQLF